MNCKAPVARAPGFGFYFSKVGWTPTERLSIFRMRIAVDGRNLVTQRTGIGRYFLEICEELIARGHKIAFHVPDKPACDVELPVSADYEIARFPGPLGRAVWSTAILPVRVRRRRPDIFWGPAHRLPPGLPADLPRILTIHDMVWRQAPDTMRFRGRLADRLLMGGAVRRADIVCVNSQATGRDVAAYYPRAAGKIRTVPPAVCGLALSPEAARTGPPARFGIDSPYVLFVGTLEPRKNLEALIRAFARLDARLRARFRLVVCGGKGWKTRDPAFAAREAGIADRVTLTGYATDAELAALYANAYCLAMPSLFEGFGLPIVEAQRFGVPVLTSNVSSMPETAGEGAILVDPNDAGSIAGGLEKLLSEAGLHADLSAGALTNSGRYSARRSADLMEEAIKEAIAARKARHRR